MYESTLFSECDLTSFNSAVTHLFGRHAEVTTHHFFHALTIYPLLFLSSPPSTFLVFSYCCFVSVPVAVWMEVLNTSMSPLKTYPPCGFTRRSVSALPVTPTRPAVITIITYRCATPSPFRKTGIFSLCNSILSSFSEAV